MRSWANILTFVKVKLHCCTAACRPVYHDDHRPHQFEAPAEEEEVAAVGQHAQLDQGVVQHVQAEQPGGDRHLVEDAGEEEEDSGGAELHVLHEYRPAQELELSHRLDQEAEGHKDDEKLHKDPDLLTGFVHVMEVAESQVCHHLQLQPLLTRTYHGRDIERRHVGDVDCNVVDAVIAVVDVGVLLLPDTPAEWAEPAEVGEHTWRLSLVLQRSHYTLLLLIRKNTEKIPI